MEPPLELLWHGTFQRAFGSTWDEVVGQDEFCTMSSTMPVEKFQSTPEVWLRLWTIAYRARR